MRLYGLHMALKYKQFSILFQQSLTFRLTYYGANQTPLLTIQISWNADQCQVLANE